MRLRETRRARTKQLHVLLGLLTAIQHRSMEKCNSTWSTRVSSGPFMHTKARALGDHLKPRGMS